MHRLWGERRDEPIDRGETLVEVLAAVVILGIAGVAVMAGLMLSVKASDIHRKETSSGAYVRSYAEAIQAYVASGHYVDCAGLNAYNVAAVTGQISDLPSGYRATQSVAKSVGADGLAAAGCGPDTGIQQVTLSIKAIDGRADERLVVVLRKPCSSSQGACS